MVKTDRRRRYALGVVIMGIVAALAACGSGSDSTTSDSTASETGTGSLDSGESLDVNNCTLLTDDEVSAFAGKTLAASEDGALGCGYVEAGQTVADFSIRSYRQDGDAAAAGAELAPSLTVIPLSGVGDDAVALADSDGSVNFLIARKGNLFVELVMTFLDVTEDSPALQDAGQLASTALDRLVAAA